MTPGILQRGVNVPLPDAPEEVGDVQPNHGVGSQMDGGTVHDRSAPAIGERRRVWFEPGRQVLEQCQDFLLYLGQSRDCWRPAP